MKLVDRYTRVEVTLRSTLMIRVLGLVNREKLVHGCFWDVLEDIANVLNMVIEHDPSVRKITLKSRKKDEPIIIIDYSFEEPRKYAFNVRSCIEKEFCRLFIRRLLNERNEGIDVDIDVKHIIEYVVDRFIEPTIDKKETNNVTIIIEKFPIVETKFKVEENKRTMLDEELLYKLYHSVILESLSIMKRRGDIFDYTIHDDKIIIDYYDTKTDSIVSLAIYYRINESTIFESTNLKLWIDYEEENYVPEKQEIYNKLIRQISEELSQYYITRTTIYKIREVRYITGIST